MPRTHYICPDGVEILMTECLEKCRLGGRCASRPTLMLMARQRTPAKKLSATEALNGTRLTYLKRTQDYAESPMNLAFALLGTFHHLSHGGIDPIEGFVEVRLDDDEGGGTPDFYDAHEKALWDYKTTGAYKINKALGKKKFERDEPTGEIYKTGEKKGQPKTKKIVEWGLGEPDMFDWQMQLSRYANLYRRHGFEVDKAYIQATVRDFTAQTERQYGLDRQIYIIPVPLFQDDAVELYYHAANAAIEHALAMKELPPPCSPRERWLDEGDPEDRTTPGRRCAKYCPVWSFCELGINAHQPALPVNGEKEGT
jgi:hypothetical protein